MTCGEGLEGFAGVDAICRPRTQQRLDHFGRVAGSNIGLQQSPYGALCAKAATHMQMITFDLIALIVHGDLGADEPDVADIVLCAGMVAAGEVDVDREVYAQARIHVISDAQCVALGVGSCEFAAS